MVSASRVNSVSIESEFDQILIVGPSWVGDMVMAQSLYKTLRDQNPNCVIDVLAPGWSLPVLSRMREVRNVIDQPTAHGELAWGKRKTLGAQLATVGYSQAILLPNSLKSALIPAFAKLPDSCFVVDVSFFNLLFCDICRFINTTISRFQRTAKIFNKIH